METTTLTPEQKALRLNLDSVVYGAFAEIGAGQEVARWFFRVGSSAGTVAKTMSAYDMAVSDAIYGKADRYVSRKRLEAMLAHEYGLIVERLDAPRGDRSTFFAFADTVATRKYGSRENGNGWIGIRFQTAPHGECSEIILHVVLRDTERLREQEAVGQVGLNLIYGAAYEHQQPLKLLASLMDNLTPERIEIDMIKFSGPAFTGIDNRLMSLRLVELGFTDATMFTADGEVVQPAEVLYRRPILVQRGRFRPLTLRGLDMRAQALAQFAAEPEVEGESPVVLCEMTLRGLDSGAGIDHEDFLARVDLLGALGLTVMVSNHGPYYELVEHLARCTQKPIGIAISVGALARMFDEKRYADLPGQILEAVGRTFAGNVRVYLLPWPEAGSGPLVTAETLRIGAGFEHLYAHLVQHRHIVSIHRYTTEYLTIESDRVLEQIQSGDAGWEDLVPPAVATRIKEGRLFGWRPALPLR